MRSIATLHNARESQPANSAKDLLSTISIVQPHLQAEDAFVVPAWFYQQRSWVEDPWNSGSASYNLPVALRISGPLNHRTLHRALHEIQKRHQVLRSVFDIVDGTLVQIVLRAHPFGMRVLDLSSTPDAEETVRTLLLQEMRRPFDLSCEPPIRALLAKLHTADHILLLKTHHIVCDDWSTGVLIQELFMLYQAFSTAAPSPFASISFQYADFVRWQEQRLREGRLRSWQEFWKKHFSDRSYFYHLACDGKRPACRSREGATETVSLSPEFVKSLVSLSERNKVTVFMTLLAAFQYLLHCYSGESDIAVGTCAANRPIAAVEGLIGRFANDLVLRCDLSGNPTLSQLLSRVRDVALSAYAHQDVPFGGVLTELVPVSDPARNPLFQVTFILQNAPKQDFQIADLSWRWLSIEIGMAKYDLAVWLKLKEGLEIVFEYDKDILSTANVRQMLRDYQTILGGVVNQSVITMNDLRAKLGSAEPIHITPAIHKREELPSRTFGYGRLIETSEPADAVVTQLVEIWRTLLGATEIAASDDFFALGGDSVRATQLLSRTEEQFGVELSLDLLLVARTLEQQATLVRQRRALAKPDVPDSPNTLPPVRAAVEAKPEDNESRLQPVKPQASAGPDKLRGRPVTRSVMRRSFNRVLHLLCRVLPGATSVRPFLHRLRGVRIQGRVAIGDDVYIENEYPESVEIEEGAMIGLRSTIVAHTRGAGKIIIGKNVFIGANCVLLTSGNRSLRIGEGAVIMASSVITNDVRPHTLYGMERAKPLAKVTKPFTQQTSYEELIASLRPLAPPTSRRG
jgi:serine acetyltransferase/acyl carrier protein